MAVYTAKVAAAKNGLPWMNAFVLGIFCDLMVCIAVYQANTAQDTAGRILGIFFPIMGFVLAGFEHCVATCIRARGHLRLYESGLYGHD